MAARHSNSGSIPAVGYLRRSTSKQEKSLADQRREIERYATEHGYTLVRWFQDDGISGDATDKRLGFQAMHKAACNGRDFDCILVWDLDRFGRFNSLEAGYWVHPLVKAGVRLVTVAEGPINWHDFTGRIVNAIKQEGKHQFLVDLSRNTARGQITTALNAYLTGQRAPYGYDRMLVDSDGEHRQRVRTGEQIARPKSWHVTLVASDEPEKLATARWLFETYAETDTGLRGLADKLNADGIPGPTGGPWYAASIKAILENEAYCGMFVWPKRRLGKYHRIAGDTVKERDASEVTCTGQPAAVRNSPEEQIVRENAFPALVDKAIWERVQEKLEGRRRRKNNGYRTHTRGNGDAYVLSGLVFCSHCGCKMHGTTSRRNKNGREYAYPRYICSTYCRSGKNNPHGCAHHALDQRAMVDLLLAKLKQAVFAGGCRDRLRDEVRKQLAAAAKSSDADTVDQLRRRVAELDRELEQGAKRLLRCPDEVADLLATELAAVRRERTRLAEWLAAAERDTTMDLESEVDATVDRLWRLSAELAEAEPARLRELLRRLVDRIEWRFEHVQRGKRVECPPEAGTITLRLDPKIFCCVNRGDWI